MGSSLTSQSFAKHECLDFNLSELPYLVSVAKPPAIFEVLWPPEPSFLVPVANPASPLVTFLSHASVSLHVFLVPHSFR